MPSKFFQPFHDVLHHPWPPDDVSSPAKRSHATLQLLEPFDLAMSLPSFETAFRCRLNALSTCWQVFQPFHNVIHPSWPQDDVSSSANRSHAIPQPPESFHLTIGLPGFDTTLRHPLNALPTCWQVFLIVPQRPAPLLAPRRRLVFRKTVRRHAPAPRSLPPRHGSLKLQDDVSPSAKRPLYLLASISNGSTMPCPPPGPKTTHRLPQNGQTSPSSSRNPSTSSWVSQASRRRIAVR